MIKDSSAIRPLIDMAFLNLNMGETLRTIFMGVTALIAVLSFYNTLKLWRQTNRPIVSAFVETDSSSNIATTYNLLRMLLSYFSKLLLH